MKVGIYISGLAESIVNESVEKYAERFMNEMNYHVTGTQYELRSEKVNYTADKYSTIAVIFEKETQEPVYKFYDFRYNQTLTEKFNNHSLLVKNFLLLLLVGRKLPVVIKNMRKEFKTGWPVQTFYLFFILGIVALSVLFMLPAIFGLAIDFFDHEILKGFFVKASQAVVSLTALILIVVPSANIMISGLATEFVCANDYMERGSQKQLVQGNLEKLVEYISENENENNLKIHIHAYSFGSILALDYVYPFGNKITANTQKYCEAIITIGAPVQLVETYYTDYYKGRENETGNNMKWINVYSFNDALATNFRDDAGIGDAEFGIPFPKTPAEKLNAVPETASLSPMHDGVNHLIPVNVNYEVVAIRKHGFIDGLMFSGIKAHGMYWDKKTEGQSCLRVIHNKMLEAGLMEVAPDFMEAEPA